MITTQAMGRVLYALTLANLNFAMRGQDAFWAQAVNAAAPDATESGLMAGAAWLATRRETSERAPKVTPGDLLEAMRSAPSGSLAERRARLRDEIAAHGEFIPAGLGREPAVEIAWRRIAQERFMDGLDRDSAEDAAWDAIGRTPPPAIEGPDVLGGLTGPERAREVLRRLRTTPDHPPLPPRTRQNVSDAPREGWGGKSRSDRLTENARNRTGQ